MDHYLDDFITTIIMAKATPKTIFWYNQGYKAVTDVLGVLGQELKNEIKIVILIFKIEVNTNLFMVSLPINKIKNVLATTAIKVLKTSFTLKNTQSWTCYLSFHMAVIGLR